MVSKKITKKDIETTVALSKLSFEDSRLDKLCESLEELIAYADVLLDGDAETVEIQDGDSLREDKAHLFENTPALIAAAPTARDGFVTVPQTVKL